MKRAKRLMNSGKYCIKRRLKFIAWMATQPTTTTTTLITTTTATIVCGWFVYGNGMVKKIMDIVEGFVDIKGFNYLCFFSFCVALINSTQSFVPKINMTS